MKNLTVKTRNVNGNTTVYTENLGNITTFLRHSEDRIEVKNGDMVNIDIYENGKLIFSGDKYEFFNQLKK